LHYMMSFYLDLINQKNKPKKLPPIFPIVLYNGDRKWTAPVEIKDLIQDHDLLGEFGVQFKYFKIAENEFEPDILLKIKNIVSTLFLAENCVDIEILAEELRLLFRKEDQEAVDLFFGWLSHLRTQNRFSEKDFEKLTTVRYEEGDVNMLLAAVKKERKTFFNEGKLEGEAKKAKEIARTMLTKGLSIELIMEITQLSQEEIERLKNGI